MAWGERSAFLMAVPAIGRVEMWRGDGRLGISVSAPFVWRCLTGSAMAPFPHPAHRTGRRIYRIRLSDKTSRLHPRRAATKLGQAYEPEVLVKVREWIGPALASPDFVLKPQPPAQPHSCVVVEHPIRFAGGSNTKVIGPSTKRAVQLLHQPCGLLPSSRSDGQRVDSVDHALEALL